MSERFYINWPLATGRVELTGAEAHHLATVCRLRAGAEVCLFNGDGRQYPARILSAARRAVVLDVLGVEQPDRELAIRLEVAAPLPKGDRSQFLIEKLTELGVTTFVPLVCRRSVIDPGTGKLERLRRYVIEASKQCGRNVLMSVAEPEEWASYCHRGELGETRVLAHPGCGEPGASATGGTHLRCAVGPEGGFTDDEVNLAVEAGWNRINLGPRMLRVETAALVLAVLASLASAPRVAQH